MSSAHHLLLLILSLMSLEALLSSTEAIDAEGFDVQLIHRDSPLSPFYNASETIYDRVVRSVRRSRSRHHYFRSSLALQRRSSPSSSSPFISSLSPGPTGEYLMSYSIGTPPVKRILIADTGSDLNWVQCRPCSVCFPQDDPLFDPKKSSTYEKLPCNSSYCTALPISVCRDPSRCEYNYGYGDGSVTEGELASETLTFDTTEGAKVKVPGIAVGCGFQNKGIFDSRDTGLAGLARGPLSLVSQMGPLIGWRFAYCLVSPGPGVMSFGRKATVAGRGLVSLPFETDVDTFYALTLRKIVIGERKIDLSGEGKGNVVSDSGTRVTILRPRVVEEMVMAVISSMAHHKNVSDPTHQFDLCYDARLKTRLPSMRFQFRGGDLVLRAANMFSRVSGDVMCLMVAAGEGLSIIGNLAQENFKVGFDLKKNKVLLAPTDCSKQ